MRITEPEDSILIFSLNDLVLDGFDASLNEIDFDVSGQGDC